MNVPEDFFREFLLAFGVFSIFLFGRGTPTVFVLQITVFFDQNFVPLLY
jgi:hypothetical protein